MTLLRAGVDSTVLFLDLILGHSLCDPVNVPRVDRLGYRHDFGSCQPRVQHVRDPDSIGMKQSCWGGRLERFGIFLSPQSPGSWIRRATAKLTQNSM